MQPRVIADLPPCPKEIGSCIEKSARQSEYIITIFPRWPACAIAVSQAFIKKRTGGLLLNNWKEYLGPCPCRATYEATMVRLFFIKKSMAIQMNDMKAFRILIVLKTEFHVACAPVRGVNSTSLVAPAVKVSTIARVSDNAPRRGGWISGGGPTLAARVAVR